MLSGTSVRLAMGVSVCGRSYIDGKVGNASTLHGYWTVFALARDGRLGTFFIYAHDRNRRSLSADQERFLEREMSEKGERPDAFMISTATPPRCCVGRHFDMGIEP
jgi:hypothetical protein